MSTSSKQGQKAKGCARTTSYSIEEDQLLCHVYLDVSQDPIVGTNQSKDNFWARVTKDYHQALPAHLKQNFRPQSSISKRIGKIKTAVSKLRGCVRQIENLHPSGASEQDILNRAKSLLAQESPYQKGFPYDHVWSIMKNPTSFSDIGFDESPCNRKRSSCEELSNADSNTSQSVGASSFNCIDLNAHFEDEARFLNDNNQSDRPIGRNKAKLKKKQTDEMKEYFKSMKEENSQIRQWIQGDGSNMLGSKSLLEKNIELQMIRAQNEKRKIELKESQQLIWAENERKNSNSWSVSKTTKF